MPHMQRDSAPQVPFASRRASALAMVALLAGATLLSVPASNATARNVAQQVCNIAAAQPTVTVGQWDATSSWSQLLSNPAQRLIVTGVLVNVTNGSGAGSKLKVFHHWSPAMAIASADLNGSVIPIAPGQSPAELQFYIEHATGAALTANIMLCTDNGAGPTNTPVPPTATAQPTGAPTAIATTVPTAVPTQTPSGASCVAAETPNIAWAANSWGTNYKILLSNPSQRALIKSLKITQSGGGTATRINVMQNWGGVLLNNVPLAAGGAAQSINLPAGPDATLQLQVQAGSASAGAIDVQLCKDGVQPPTEIDLDPSINAELPPADKRSMQFQSLLNGEQRQQLSGAGVTDTCIDRHNLYWTYGPDGMAYATWHPADDGVCAYRHEHGDIPTKADDGGDLLTLFGGVPPFGYALEQQHHTGGMMRHEDHTGNKITIAPSYRAAFGFGSNVDNAMHDAGFDCKFMSKIHQGSSTTDAFADQLHEYFLAVSCEDYKQNVTPVNGVVEMDGVGAPSAFRTRFSVKLLLPFGPPDKFKDICSENVFAVPSGNASLQPGYPRIDGPDGMPLKNAMTQVTVQSIAINPPQAPNPREFFCARAGVFEWRNAAQLAQMDLWTQHMSIKTPVGYVHFQPYYIVKNSARVWDADNRRVTSTIDECYTGTALRKHGNVPWEFCKGLPDTRISASDPSSTFNGTLRALNFKRLTLKNEGGPTEFCTDLYGQSPTDVQSGALKCPLGKIHQKAASYENGFAIEAGSIRKRCWKDLTGAKHCVGKKTTLPLVAGENRETVLEIAGALNMWRVRADDPTRFEAETTRVPIPAVGAPAANGASRVSATQAICPDPARMDQDGFPIEVLPADARYLDNAFCPHGIGFEWISDHRNDSSQIRTPN
jgi:hypothetical protein